MIDSAASALLAAAVIPQLRTKPWDKEKREEHLNVIIDETDRLNILVGDILTLSKLQANADIMNIETFNLTEAH